MRLATTALLCLLVSSCTFQTFSTDGWERKCRAECVVPAGAGEACVEWAENASNECQGRFTVVSMCCTVLGACETYNEFVKNRPCICFSPYHGQVPGQGCGRGRVVDIFQ